MSCHFLLQGIFPVSPALAGGFLTVEPLGYFGLKKKKSMCKFLRAVADKEALWKCKVIRMMMALDLKFASLHYVLFTCYLSRGIMS